MGAVIKPLAALWCSGCRDGWHMTAAQVVQCEKRAAASTAPEGGAS